MCKDKCQIIVKGMYLPSDGAREMILDLMCTECKETGKAKLKIGDRKDFIRIHVDSFDWSHFDVEWVDSNGKWEDDIEFECNHEKFRFRYLDMKNERIYFKCHQFYCDFERFLDYDRFALLAEADVLDLTLRELDALEFTRERINAVFN